MSVATRREIFDCSRLVSVFEGCFGVTENTSLVGGAQEPLYRPADDNNSRNLLYFREDYFASALHETAHWCIAGAERRRLVDFGYWYAPEGRSADEQRAFEAVEVKPQALEWIFSLACGYRFRISVDNFADRGELVDTSDFRRKVATQARHWQRVGLPPRAARFTRALRQEFATPAALPERCFEPEALA
ncbi:elongation factor P hydroxylase [Seongchinamella unica]|uniref:elongation factor P hydroxylase n=1 Tax=Seongchinamella unica TaxID=2547392 RepID=UPI001EEE918E|nr:elongation factor P hydroxylase [Seongchinamella unica]